MKHPFHKAHGRIVRARHQDNFILHGQFGEKPSRRLPRPLPEKCLQFHPGKEPLARNLGAGELPLLRQGIDLLLIDIEKLRGLSGGHIVCIFSFCSHNPPLWLLIITHTNHKGEEGSSIFSLVSRGGLVVNGISYKNAYSCRQRKPDTGFVSYLSFFSQAARFTSM